MVIQNSDFTYVVVRKLESQDVEQYLCRRLDGGEEEMCQIAALPDRYASELVPYLEQQIEGGSGALEDFFTDNGTLYIVTAARPFGSLKDRLKEQSCSLSERMAIAKNLLSELLLQGLDDPFCCAALDIGRIGVSDLLEIGLRYDLDAILDHEQIRFEMTQYRLAQVFSALFQKELGQGSLAEVTELVDRLEQGRFSSLLELYGWFLPVAETWSSRDEKELVPTGFWIRAWECAKRLAAKLVWLWKLVLILLALLYLVLSVKAFFAEPAMSANFKEIGTLKIE